jgi:hypothetical protein
MSFKRVSGLTTIKHDEHAFWEISFDGANIGPCFLQAELLATYDNTDMQLQSNNQGVILRQQQGGGFRDLVLHYTVDIWNSDQGSAQYFLTAGTF